MATTTPSRPFKSLPCFSELGPEAIEWLGDCVREQSFNKGQVIFLEGEMCPGLFVVKSGSVKLYRISPEGEEQIVRIINQGGCFECVPLLDGGTNPVSAQALENTDLYLLSAADFDTLFTSNPRLSVAFSSIMARRLRSLVNVVGDFSVRRVSPRLATLLYQLAEKHGDALVVSPTVPLSQQHLACMLGCSRQAVNTALRKLVADNIVRMEGHRIVVLDAEALKKVS
ncbi:MAG: hypothetical protein A2Z29_02520 [Chloroflexi bacterium RBG_16_56_11]|nr:MAG: hypothetical protein A2Z29_02520 [Chloroflexi bacterium RBG_16_56_11]